MSEEQSKSVKLEGGPKQTSSRVEIGEDGSLEVSYYDFSDEAEQSLGGEVFYVVTVGPSGRVRLQNSLELGTEESADAHEQLLTEMKARFSSYFDVKQWLDDQEIPYSWHSDPFP